MIIYIKIGTMAADRLSVVRKRKPPKVGETFEVRERGQDFPPWTLVHCDAIKDVSGEPLYYVERM